MRTTVCLAAAVALGIASACSSAPDLAEAEVRVLGSDTMLELNRRLAEGYMRAHPGMIIRVEGGGSAIGIEALIEHRASVAAISRPLSSAEVSAIHDHFGTLGVRFLVAQDALSVWVNCSNLVRSLDLEQLRAIFDGSVTNWAAVGGRDVEIAVVVRPPNSGTHRFFRDHVLGGGPYVPRALTAPTTRAVLAAVADDPNAIGYGGHAYNCDGVVRLAVEGVAPTAEEVGRGRYPLTRYLAFLTAEPPTGTTRQFIEWCLSSGGQKVVAEVGYIPLWRR